MRFSHKLKKLGDPDTFYSAKRHLGRALLTRKPSRLDAQSIIDTIDREKFEQIRARYAVKGPSTDWRKFLDLEKWTEVNLRRACELELDYGRRRSILDIGSGAGYFLYICKWLGHNALGLDVEGVPLYPEMARLLGLRRVNWRIERFTPLPDLGRKFDLITAFMICFDRHDSGEPWGVEEWSFLLNDFTRHLKPRGRIALELNLRTDGILMTDELRRFFESRGARTNRRQVIFDAPPRTSLGESVTSVLGVQPR